MDFWRSWKADAKDSVAHAAQQEGSKWVGSEVEMMDGPYGRAPFGGHSVFGGCGVFVVCVGNILKSAEKVL